MIETNCLLKDGRWDTLYIQSKIDPEIAIGDLTTIKEKSWRAVACVGAVSVYGG